MTICEEIGSFLVGDSYKIGQIINTGGRFRDPLKRIARIRDVESGSEGGEEKGPTKLFVEFPDSERGLYMVGKRSAKVVGKKVVLSYLRGLESLLADPEYAGRIEFDRVDRKVRHWLKKGPVS